MQSCSHPQRRTRAPLGCLVAAAIAALPTAHAQADASLVAAAPPERVEVTGHHYDNAVGTTDAASQGTIRAELLKSRPALRPGEVLEFVPGVIVTQHSGDGKANQYFLRGFNLDHGTDFATTVNGLPVNMPTNGHGQGYSDLNFLLPELVDRIEYRKGPYFARNGDFSSAGSADIAYVTQLAPFAEVTLGERGYRRAVAGGSTATMAGQSLLGAFEAQVNDGPWTVPENLRKLNGVLTYAFGDRSDGASISAMGYDARWTATDQVPQRLIDAGSFNGQPFGRYDSLDPTDGGETSRYSLSGEWHRLDDSGVMRVSAYAMRYRLQLYSNFTYVLDDPVRGDQFAQTDDRRVVGFAASRDWAHDIGDAPSRSEIGLQARGDRIRVGLLHTQQRETLSTTRDDEVDQLSAGIYAQNATEWTPWLRSVVGLRADRYRFDVDSIATPANSGRATDTQWSPKLALVLGPWARTEFFVNAGRGFHSNDARGTTDAEAPVPGLVSSRGVEVGMRTEAVRGLQSSLALWQLDFDSELVYVGDAGTTEPNRPSRRYGVEWNNRWVPKPWLLLDADLAWSHARFRGDAPEGNYIPNSVDSVASAALTLKETGPWAQVIGPWYGSLQWRYLGSGPLIEDNSVRSRPSSTANLRIGRKLGRYGDLMLDVFNLTDRAVNDIEYFYESQLPGEVAPVSDKHVHAAEPRTMRVTWQLTF